MERPVNGKVSDLVIVSAEVVPTRRNRTDCEMSMRKSSSERPSGGEPISFGPLKQHPAFQVHLTWRAIRLSLRESSRKSKEEVRRGSYSVPILIWQNPGISPRELADCLYLDASKVALFLRQLDEEGFLDRVPSAEDGRRIGLHLTKAGEGYARQALQLSFKYEEPVLRALSEEELSTLVDLLEKIQGSID